MLNPNPLYYVFQIEWKSCAGHQWNNRSYAPTRLANEGSPVFMAGQMITKAFRPGETGVRVNFLGVQAKKDDPITPIGQFTLTLERTAPITEEEETRRGEIMARVLGLRLITHGDQAGRYDLEGGTKTPLGLFRTMRRILEEGR